MSDIVERLRDMADGGSGERRALELMEEAADEIERLWAVMLDADAIAMDRAHQLAAEIKRRGEEIEQLRATVEWQRRALQINSEEIDRRLDGALGRWQDEVRDLRSRVARQAAVIEQFQQREKGSADD